MKAFYSLPAILLFLLPVPTLVRAEAPEPTAAAIPAETTELTDGAITAEPVVSESAGVQEIRVTTKNGAVHVYQVSAEPPTAAAVAAMALLTPEEVAIFQTKKTRALEKLCSGLTRLKPALGGFLAAKQKLGSIFARLRGKSARARTPAPELAHEIVQNFVSAVNEQLWEQPRLVASSNEYGVVVIANAEGGVRIARDSERGWGRYYAGGLGLAINFNSDRESVSCDLFLNREVTKSGRAVVAQAVVSAKWGVHLSYRSPDADSILQSRGEVNNPPGPLSIRTYPNESIQIGTFNSLGLTVPFAGALLYHNRAAATRTPLFRIEVSHLLPWKVRISIPFLKQRRAVP